MLRDKSLIPLSRQHQHALALCVRIDRASPIPVSDLAAWQSEITQLCESEIEIHFTAEEQALFPAARRFDELALMLDELERDHADLRAIFARAQGQQLSAADLLAAAQRLSSHIRKEERQLFERLQELMSQEQLALLGKQLDEALKEAAESCLLPTEATRLKPSRLT